MTVKKAKIEDLVGGLYRGFNTASSRLICWRGRLYRWSEGQYYELADYDIEFMIARIFQSVGESVTPQRLGEFKMNLQAKVFIDSEKTLNSWLNRNDGPRVLVMGNGIVCLDGREDNGRPKLLPHTPDYLTLVKLPYEYVPEARCLNWLKFLDEVMESDEERMRLLQQWTGYLFTPTLKEQRFLLCVGEGANGKGVFFEVVLAMLGLKNCSSLPLSRFGQRFALISTYGKLLNATSEGISHITPQAEAVLKEYTAGDMMTFEQKYRDTFSAKPTAKLMIATNELPSFSDKTEGVWRRMLLVPFERTFTEDQQNKNLAEELKRELPGIFNWAYEGMVDLENGFVVPAKCKDAIEQYRRDVNPAKVFLQENYRVNPEAGGVPCGVLYSNYYGWCRAKGYKPLSEANLGKEIKRVFSGVQKTRPTIKGKRTHVYANLAVQDDAEIEDPNFEYQYSRKG